MLFLGLAGCTEQNSPDVVAGRFVDAYYIEFDFEGAKTYAHGAALQRIEREAALVADARKKTAIQDAKARVYYEAPTRHDVSGEMVHFRYVLDIRRGPTTLERPSTIMVAKRNGVWKVIQFREEGAPIVPVPGQDRRGTATSTPTSLP